MAPTPSKTNKTAKSAPKPIYFSFTSSARMLAMSRNTGKFDGGDNYAWAFWKNQIKAKFVAKGCDGLVFKPRPILPGGGLGQPVEDQEPVRTMGMTEQEVVEDFTADYDEHTAQLNMRVLDLYPFPRTFEATELAEYDRPLWNMTESMFL
mmetsp:Transcript_20027/g.40377  ORF Transcript_20027/g.40377 Transcript_20027/m.40377 type:complete len:150 (-) Transcript_20027:127-576(-)|eukprot:CAMPEP_0170428018 /NCGR_PEP_ID=MMETSP0117_2-20130122/39543_1 /TAXON_ID=400756 /ORGANISM="Durinskia baltica, Strain CSIRO CS-38" /LENGTH=149 /DNA_ID=CAMNT_0010687277 /DNA_START=19 /DNA_END=468 /DNA_ORIENTATION=-